MKSVLALAVAAMMVASASAVQLEAQTGAEVEGNCFPQCTWNCDQPSCPAVCEPQCEKPSCELRCEKLPATSCDIRCEKPQCEVRCSKSNCQSGGCPMCENVCMPAKCQTVCTPSTPVCKPTCSAPKCSWSCRKPLTCPKPKCNLGCAGSSQASTCTGGAGAAFLEQKSCCSCQEFNNMQTALEMATRAHVAKHGAEPSEDLMPSFVEVAHSLRLDEQLSGEAKCCPCSA